MRLFIVSLIMTFAYVGLGQGQKISGIVRFGGEGIPGATVQIGERGTVTDGFGRFEFSDLSAGTHKVEIRSMGYKARIIEVKSGSQMEVEMEESSLNLDGVVVTGTMQPTFISNSPIKVDVVTSSHINTYLPSAASGLVESISLVNGVQEVVACGVCFTNSISINGLPGPYTAVLMDGTPIYGNLASIYGLNGIPSMIIDRFEVIKGPSSTLYGSEAVAGVINIITKNPENQPPVSVDVMMTSHLESFGNFVFVPKFKKISGFVGVNYAYINDYDDRNHDGFGDQANLDRISIFSKWNFPTRIGKPFTVSAKYYYEDRRNGVEQFLADRAYRKLRGDEEIYGESIYTDRIEVFGTYPFSKSLSLDYSLSGHKQNSYYGSSFYKAEQNIGYTNLIWRKSLTNHDLLGGYTNRVQYYNDNTVATERQDNAGNVIEEPSVQYVPGIFLQDEWVLTDRFTVLTGARLDHYSEHGFIPAPRLNLKFKAGKWTTIRSNFGTGFRIVNLFTEDHAFLSGQREVMIKESLKPERSYNFSFNTNHVFTLGESQGTIDVDVFYTHFANKIIPDYSDPQLIQYENTSGFARSRGIGVMVNQEFRFPLAFNLGVNIQKATETEFENGIKTTLPILLSQSWSGVFTANYTIKPMKLNLAYTARMTGPVHLPEVYDLDDEGNPLGQSRPTISEPYSIHNLQVKKSLKGRFSVYGGVQNIFDYFQPYSPLVGMNDPNAFPGFSDRFDTSYAYAPLHGREFYLGVSWSGK